MTTSISGTTTSSRPESRTFSRSAMITPPTMVIGATPGEQGDDADTGICWTSLVVRVISDGAPKSLHLAQRETLHPAEERGSHVAAHPMAADALR